jgi:hypothetical protein
MQAYQLTPSTPKYKVMEASNFVQNYKDLEE